MILVRAPLRISIGGGGTDMPAYYENSGTVFSSMAINQYIYISINERFYEEIFIRYSRNELVDSVSEIEHPIIKQTLVNYSPDCKGVEICSLADIPSGTGLGSSGTFGVGLQLCLRKFLGLELSQAILAQESTAVEMVQLERPIGLQDQYISAYGGLTEFIVDKNGGVEVDKKELSESTSSLIENNLLLIYSGTIRDSKLLLSKQKEEMSKANILGENSFDNLVELGQQTLTSIMAADLDEYSKYLHDYWLIKKERQKSNTPTSLVDLYDHLYDKAFIKGGKLVGAGGGGFLLVVTENKKKIIDFLNQKRISTVDFNIDYEGAKILDS